MSRRSAALAGLMVLVLATGAVAQDASPEATPLFAPDDLASALPTRVDDVDLQVWDVSDPSSLGDGEADVWRDLAERVGKEPNDIRAAVAVGVPTGGSGPDDIPLVIGAFRFDGVPASTWAEAYWDVNLRALLGAGVEDEYVSGWREVDGRDVYSVLWTPDVMAELRALDPSMHLPEDTGHWLYPRGEVLFWVAIPFDWPVPTPCIGDVLVELP